MPIAIPKEFLEGGENEQTFSKLEADLNSSKTNLIFSNTLSNLSPVNKFVSPSLRTKSLPLQAIAFSAEKILNFFESRVTPNFTIGRRNCHHFFKSFICFKAQQRDEQVLYN